MRKYSRPSAPLLEGGFPAHLLPIEGAACEGFGVPMISSRLPRFDVLLDGVPVEHVVAWSVPAKWIVRLVTDSQDRPVRQGDGFATERLTGDVSFRLHEGAPSRPTTSLLEGGK